MGSPLELAHKQPGQKGKAILQMLQGRAEGEEETLKRKSVAYNDPASITRYLNASKDRISCESTYLAVCVCRAVATLLTISSVLSAGRAPPLYTYATLSSCKTPRKAGMPLYPPITHATRSCWCSCPAGGTVKMSPRTLDKWELDHKELVYIEQVGAGAFGTVWKVLPSTSPLNTPSSAAQTHCWRCMSLWSTGQMARPRGGD